MFSVYVLCNPDLTKIDMEFEEWATRSQVELMQNYGVKFVAFVGLIKSKNTRQ